MRGLVKFERRYVQGIGGSIVGALGPAQIQVSGIIACFVVHHGGGAVP